MCRPRIRRCPEAAFERAEMAFAHEPADGRRAEADQPASLGQVVERMVAEDSILGVGALRDDHGLAGHPHCLPRRV